MNPPQYCKKLVFIDGENVVHTVLGILLEEDELFINFKTAARTYRVLKTRIISIETTNTIFNPGWRSRFS